MKIVPVILCGGSGSRLWPLSREYYPKPLLPLTGDKTLFQQTVIRATAISGAAPPLIVCNEEHRFMIAEQARTVEARPSGILLEPEGRNTAPALTLAALRLVDEVPDTLMLVAPADHLIRDNDAFRQAVTEAAGLAAQGWLVTFGIVPHHPETGYGYIRRGSDLNRGFEVAEFVEKPDAEMARGYLEAGGFFWNSGIFLMRADRWLEELGEHAPDILEVCREAMAEGRRDEDFQRVSSQAFSNCRSDSIDYAVMEKTRRAAVIPMDCGWSDIGAWSALWDVSDRDEGGNVTRGDVITHDVQNSLILAGHRCISAIGVTDIAIVETADAVLVTPLSRAQDVKHIVSRLKAENRDEYRLHRRVYRPWGDYESIDNGERYQVKRITVKPGAALSLQMHHHRAEHWIVVSGTARVTKGDKVFILTENESTYIPLGVTHRLENPGTIPLEIIEVQSGSYLGEDDIVRFEDIYDRS